MLFIFNLALISSCYLFYFFFLCCFTGLRGCTADVIILEEAAYLDPQLFHQVIVPLLTVDHTALLAISSPGDEFNYYSILQDLKNQYGLPLFKNIKIGLACDSCVANNVEVCPHVMKKLPAWKSEGRHELVRAIYAGNTDIMRREAEGQVVSNRIYLYPKKWVDAFERQDTEGFYYGTAQYVHISIDPSGGGSQSDFVICSMIKERGKWIVSYQLTHTHTYPPKVLQIDHVRNR